MLFFLLINYIYIYITVHGVSGQMLPSCGRMASLTLGTVTGPGNDRRPQNTGSNISCPLQRRDEERENILTLMPAMTASD